MRGAVQLAGSMAEASETIMSIVAGVEETPRPVVDGQGVWMETDMVQVEARIRVGEARDGAQRLYRPLAMSCNI